MRVLISAAAYTFGDDRPDTLGALPGTCDAVDADVCVGASVERCRILTGVGGCSVDEAGQALAGKAALFFVAAGC